MYRANKMLRLVRVCIVQMKFYRQTRKGQPILSWFSVNERIVAVIIYGNRFRYVRAKS